MSDPISYEYARRYTDHGWKLVHMPAGTKAPATFGWQTRPTDPEHWLKHSTHNMGLLHGLSGTCALDIDHMPHTRLICEALAIDLAAILSTAPRIVGRPDRGKVLFRAPEGEPLTTRKLSWPVEGATRISEVVFELRAGSVQDVLPPSIHPDTLNPYTWAGADWKDLPLVPEALLIIWREWDRFRPQLASLCPWAIPTPRPAPRKRHPEQVSVIDSYNASVTITDALESAGYRQIGKRWLSPNSSTGIPGVVVFDDGRAYSHHASDPFDPAHAFDAFDVFAHYQHFGNFSAAVRAAGELLEIERLPVYEETAEDREHQAAGARIFAAWEANAASQVPTHLKSIPGVLGAAAAYSAKTAFKPQPQFDVQIGLALGSVVMGRRFVTSHRNMSSLFFLNVGKTGSGKEHANTVIEDILEAADLMSLRGPNGYTSATGVLSSLVAQPCHIAIIDEFGAMLTSAAARGNQHKADSLVMLMEAFGRQTKSLRNQGYATLSLTQAQKDSLQVSIKHPSITLLGMTTPETFYEAIGGKDVSSGFLNRFVIVESKRPREVSRSPAPIPVPPDLVQWCKDCATAQAPGAGNLQDIGYDFPPEPVVVQFSEAAVRLLSDYEADLIDRQNSLPPVRADMLNRSREIAMRVALIVSRSLGEGEISEAAAQWAIDYIDFYARQTLEAMGEHLAEGDTDSLRKKVASAIMESGTAGLTMAELLRQVPKLGNLKKPERDGLLAMICDDYPIERAKLEAGPKGGRPFIIHRKVADKPQGE